MATDKSSPRIRTIATTALVAVGVLVGLKFAFDSYYVTLFEAEERRRVTSVQPSELVELRATEKRAFARARVPLARSMEIVAHGRAEPIPGLEDGGIIPEPSSDTAPLIGWAGLAKDRRSSSASSAPAGSVAPSAAAATAPSDASSASSPPTPARGSATAAPR